MIGSIIEIAIGYFVTYHIPKIVGAKGTSAKVIKIIGIIFLIGGFISLVRNVF